MSSVADERVCARVRVYACACVRVHVRVCGWGGVGLVASWCSLTLAHLVAAAQLVLQHTCERKGQAREGLQWMAFSQWPSIAGQSLAYGR